MESTIESLRKSVDNYESEKLDIFRVSEELAAISSENERLRLQLLSAESEIAKLRVNLDESKHTCVARQHESSMLAEELAASTAVAKQLESGLLASQLAVEARRLENSDLKHETWGLKQAVSTCELKISQLEVEIAARDEELEQIKSDYDNVKISLNESAGVLESYVSEINDLKSMLYESKQTYVERLNEINRHSGTMKETNWKLSSHVSGLVEELKRREDSHSLALQEIIMKKNGEIADLQASWEQQLRDSEAAFERATSELIDSHTVETSKLREEIFEVEKRALNAQSQIIQVLVFITIDDEL